MSASSSRPPWFCPQLILISAGFDGHSDDPLASCVLETDSYAQMTAHVLKLAARVGAPVGAVLEGGSGPGALADSVLAMLGAFGGQARAESIAPHPPFTDVQHHVEEARTRLAAFDTVQAAAHDLKSAAEHPDLNAPARLQPSAEALRTD